MSMYLRNKYWIKNDLQKTSVPTSCISYNIQAGVMWATPGENTCPAKIFLRKIFLDLQLQLQVPVFTDPEPKSCTKFRLQAHM